MMISADQYERTPELLRQLLPQLPRLPIFPLPDAYLLPNTLAPLHVFEPRYRELVADCLRGGRAMAVAMLKPGYEANYHGRPPVWPIAGAGLIMDHRANPDGTCNILVRGLLRVRIEAELPETRPYRLVRASPLYEQVPPEFDAHSAMQLLVTLTERVAERLPARSSDGVTVLRTLCQVVPQPGELADVLTWLLFTDRKLQRQVLEAVDVSTRVDLVAGGLARILASANKHAQLN
jgi:hypothetical protein